MRNLKTTNLIMLIIALLICGNSLGQVKKEETKLSKHLDVVSLLQKVKTSASSIQSYTKDWEGDDLNEVKKRYLELQVADANLIARYTVIIKNYRTAKKEKMTISKEMGDLEKANNSYVTYFYEHMKDHPTKSGVGIWGEIITVVFSAGKEIYDFVNGINKEKMEKYLADISDKSIPNWGVTDSVVKNDDKTASTSKTEK
ncbi:hypothetical protein [Sphingobacterium siyangense]|uniref:hypothetical protein n=1 Tax=Sphingobacterium siyangense TaxID=459529 RepID=UPI002FDD170D